MALWLELAGAGRSSLAPGGALRRVEGSELALLSLEGGGDLRCAERDDAFLRLVSAGTQNGSLVWVIRWSAISDRQTTVKDSFWVWVPFSVTCWRQSYRKDLPLMNLREKCV